VPLSPDARNLRALAFLRICVGVFFLVFAQYKILSTQFTLHGGFQFWINKFLTEGGAYPFMAPILRNFVLPHATPIAFLVAYGELAIGLALLLGVFVRPASIAGLIFVLTLLFPPTTPAPPPRSGNTSAQA
jgi:thiosulfate dehydrogenase (quinone) large subunit